MNIEDNAGKLIAGGLIGLALVIAAGMTGCPAYNVYIKEKEGEGDFKKAELDRRIKVLEAQAELDSAKLKAQSEVARAHGVAEANKIVADGLKGHDEYLRYLWIEKVSGNASKEIVYVPTEANLPILEAGRNAPRVTVAAPVEK